MLHITDWFPTILSLAKISVPNGLNLDGIDQSTLFMQSQSRHSNSKKFKSLRSRMVYGITEKLKNWKSKSLTKITPDKIQAMGQHFCR